MTHLKTRFILFLCVVCVCGVCVVCVCGVYVLSMWWMPHLKTTRFILFLCVVCVWCVCVCVCVVYVVNPPPEDDEVHPVLVCGVCVVWCVCVCVCVCVVYVVNPPPEDDEVHPVLVCVVVLVQTLLDHLVELVQWFHLGVHAFVRFSVRFHVVAKHQTAQVFLLHLRHKPTYSIKHATTNLHKYIISHRFT